MVSRSNLWSSGVSINSLSGTKLDLCAGVGSNAGDNLFEDRLGRLPIRVRVEVKYDAMAQHGGSDRLHVLDGQVQTPARQGQPLSAFDERLGPPGRTAVTNKFLGHLVAFAAAFGLGGHHEIDRVALHMRGDQ